MANEMTMDTEANSFRFQEIRSKLEEQAKRLESESPSAKSEQSVSKSAADKVRKKLTEQKPVKH